MTHLIQEIIIQIALTYYFEFCHVKRVYQFSSMMCMKYDSSD